MKSGRRREEYWRELRKAPLFWIGLVLALSWFFIHSLVLTAIGLVLLFVVKYRIMPKIKNVPAEGQPDPNEKLNDD